MSIKLTSEEAKKAGYKKIPSGTKIDKTKGVNIDAVKNGDLCYVGPCEPGAGARTVCYRSENGCDDCWLEDDLQCNNLSATEQTVELTTAFKIERLKSDFSQSVLVTERTIYSAPTSNTPIEIKACVNFFYHSGGLGIRNNCSECKVAVVNWDGRGIYYYKVAGYSQIVVARESSFGQLIGENPC
ncbi:hypothetical protein [Chitinimonas taiwanensis]|uniref:Uncharacterized protein n=1 Tax=Chitinimonas taiwanensis DSM 18899 TaxID=1121279 RepID=A0A1K2H7P8_9NEIS|nr:hypothetical protein [Chitinimonas taiwanensis]SFZ72714.1 hypothetical protein SAMN02745887_00701 [Chitinimonas taiwanensis DSM 18899]